MCALIIIIDNYYSFVFNIARYLRRLGESTQVIRNDAVTVTDIARLKPNAIVISPGPCTQARQEYLPLSSANFQAMSLSWGSASDTNPLGVLSAAEWRVPATQCTAGRLT
ncbi:glutamine amidotransferase-related protein [Bradyrhizobium australiense]|uniref:glutamine amidotransferase-related protein n=1 Tax=Bradyrhizobium australiense TaxID=2721161 RepID=UPI0035D97968